ncbi:MAG TPA: diguanylate cyclase [Burkholderiales bacterium]
MHQDDSNAAGSVMEPLLTMLQTLRTTPGGAELLARIERGHEVRGALMALIEKAFLTFTRNAVDRYARTTGTDRITRLKIRLIEQRLAKLIKLHPETRDIPDLPDITALAQHLVAQLWAAGAGLPKQPAAASTAAPAADRLAQLKPLQQTLVTELDRVARANLESIASLGSVELTLKSAETGELESWREILRDTARELIDDYRELGDNLRHAQQSANEIGRQIEAPTGIPSSGEITVNRPDLLRRIEAEIRRTQRYHQPLTLALLGPDQLENIRVLVGPQAASEVLRRYLESVTSCARAYDTVSGCNTHKLLWLLPGADAEQGVKALKKAQERLMSSHYHYAGRLRPLPTFSAGVVGYAAGEKPTHFLARAEVVAAHARRVGPDHIESDRRNAPPVTAEKTS